MKKSWMGVGAAALLLSMAWITAPAGADDPKPPTIKEIMTTAHKGGDSLIQKIGKALKSGNPAWEDVDKNTKELVKLGQALSKNEPPQGDKASWEKLTSAYVKNAKALSTAVEARERDQAMAAHKKLAGSCASCHKVHKQ